MLGHGDDPSELALASLRRWRRACALGLVGGGAAIVVGWACGADRWGFSVMVGGIFACGVLALRYVSLSRAVAARSRREPR